MATVYKRGNTYHASYTDGAGNRVTRSLRTSDKSAAKRIAAKLEADAALRREGVIDPALEALADQGKRSIESHLADFEAMMRAADRNDRHI